MIFVHPLWLLLLLPLLAVCVYRLWLGNSSTFFFSDIKVARMAGASWRSRLIRVPSFLQFFCSVLLVVAIARPQYGTETSVGKRRGVAIEMLLDISSSMDIRLGGGAEDVSRIKAAKEVFHDFILGNGDDLKGRVNDVIGLVSFARYADTVCPMTDGLRALVSIVDDIEIESRPNEDGTAYGDALMLGAARLMNIEKNASEESSTDDIPDIKSKIMILLTDGENNCGRHLPMEASLLAKKWGIRIYTIFLGSDPVVMLKKNNVDVLNPAQKLLMKICDDTGGICWVVHDYDSLRSVYAKIDALERSELKVFKETVYRDLFPDILLISLLGMILEILLSKTLLRRIP